MTSESGRARVAAAASRCRSRTGPESLNRSETGNASLSPRSLNRILPRRFHKARDRRATAARSAPTTGIVRATRSLARRVGETGLDPASLFARFLVDRRADTVDFEGVSLQVEFGFKDDEFLGEAIWMRAQVMVRLEVLFLWCSTRPFIRTRNAFD